MNENFFFKTVKKNKFFFKNFTYLSIVEALNVLVPFITLPYLINVLGKENYGLVIFSQSIALYFLIIQNFGLNTYAIKEISVNTENKKKINYIFSSVISIKIILFCVNLLLLYFLSFLFPIIEDKLLIIFFSMWVCLFDILFPKWYFQGIERMKWITLIFFISKIFSLIFIFICIQDSNDFLKVPIIYALGGILSSLISFHILFNKYKVKFIFQNLNSLILTIKESSTFFISEVSVAIFANSNKVILGLTVGMTNLSYYDLAEKIVNTFRSIPLTIVRDSIYPRVAKTKNLNIVKNVTKVMTFYAIIVVIGLYIFSPLLIKVLGGNDMKSSIDILRIFSITIFTTHISNYYITVGLWSLGYIKSFRNLMVFSALLFFALIGVLWILDIINIYTLTSLPIFVDIYLIIHTLLIYKKNKLHG